MYADPYRGVTAVLSIFMVRMNFFISSMHEQLLDLATKAPDANPIVVGQLVDFFNYALPAGGILSIPFLGYLLDYSGFVVSFLVLSLSGTVFGVLG